MTAANTMAQLFKIYEVINKDIYFRNHSFI